MKPVLALLGLAMAAAVHAAPITFQDVYNPADVKLSAGGNNMHFYSHNILDNGFVPDSLAIVSAKLTLDIADDGDADYLTILFWQIPWSLETARLTADNVILSEFEVGGGRQFLVSSALLQTDGRLDISIKALEGDFWFRSSTLDVTAQAVPEPGTLALTGLGLLGMGFALRRRKA